MANKPSAAFFDLDRTLLSGSSAPVFQRHLAENGLGTPSSVLSDVYYKIFERIGENELLMQAARLASRVAKGWDPEVVRIATTAAADELLLMVQPFAAVLFDQYRANGTKLVLATTSPDPWVRPLAEAMGFDDVVATRWVERDGLFTGETDGPFLWGRQKRNACREWAKSNGIRMRDCSAYSDSYFDAPLLGAVGSPVAINPDLRLAALAALKGWPIRYLDAPSGVVKIAGREIQEWMRPLSRPELIPNASIEITGLANIPRRGGAIVVGNHRSYFDPTVMAMVVSMAGRNARFLGKKEVFDAPIIGKLAAAAGGIRVDRGTGSNEPLQAAADALAGGDIVVIMPEGTIPRGPAFFETELQGRWGAARLAALTGAPIVPVGLWGTEVVWPRSARLPNLNPMSPPTVTASVGEPITVPGDDHDADTQAIMAAIMAQLPPEASIAKTPTDEELRATFPHGYTGDPSAETTRRPGSDT